MDAARELTFRLQHFGWSSPAHLELMGVWEGLDPEDGDVTPVLRIRARDDEYRSEVPISAQFWRDGRWSATFGLQRDAGTVEEVALEMSNGYLLDLPAPSSTLRRFGRKLLRAQRIEGADAPLVEQEGPSTGQPSALELYTALVQAREDVEELSAATARAQEQAWQARRDAERERERRHSEGVRLREAVATARALAEGQVAEERRVAQDLRQEFDALRETLAEERRDRSNLNVELDALRADSEVAGQLRARLRELERDLETARAELEVGREDARRREREIADLHELRAELETARTELESSASVRAELAQSRRAEDEARVRAAALEARLEAVREALDAPL